MFISQTKGLRIVETSAKGRENESIKNLENKLFNLVASRSNIEWAGRIRQAKTGESQGVAKSNV